MSKGFLFLLLIPFTSISQYHYKADTNCYSSQFIAIPDDSVHHAFFDAEDQMSLFETVYYLNRKHLLSFSAEKDAIESCCVEMFNDYRSALRVDSTHHSFYDLEMNWDVQIYGFLDFYASLEPINDENFEPMFEVDSKGNISFIYPEIDTTYYGFVSIPEIRIEERMNTELDYFYEIPYETGMQIEQFGFTAFDYSGRPELFWVNYNLFRIAMKKVILKPKIFRGMTC